MLNDGCEVDTPNADFPFLKFEINNTENYGTFYGNAAGDYNIPVPKGSHTNTPVFENDYFTANPTTKLVLKAMWFRQKWWANLCITKSDSRILEVPKP